MECFMPNDKAREAADLKRKQDLAADPTLGMSRTTLAQSGLTRSDRPPPAETAVCETAPSARSKKTKVSMKIDKLKPAFGLGWMDDAHTTCKTACGAVVKVIDVAEPAYWHRGKRKSMPTTVPSVFKAHGDIPCAFKLIADRRWDESERDCVCVLTDKCFEE